MQVNKLSFGFFGLFRNEEKSFLQQQAELARRLKVNAYYSSDAPIESSAITTGLIQAAYRGAALPKNVFTDIDRYRTQDSKSRHYEDSIQNTTGFVTADGNNLVINPGLQDRLDRYIEKEETTGIKQVAVPTLEGVINHELYHVEQIKGSYPRANIPPQLQTNLASGLSRASAGNTRELDAEYKNARMFGYPVSPDVTSLVLKLNEKCLSIAASPNSSLKQ